MSSASFLPEYGPHRPCTVLLTVLTRTMYELVPSRESAMQPVRRVGRRVCAGAPYLCGASLPLWAWGWGWVRAAAGQICLYNMFIVQLNNVCGPYILYPVVPVSPQPTAHRHLPSDADRCGARAPAQGHST